ncbi:HrpB1 family type III secretion system apparatus protein [Thalassoglobus sp. JC818]|uniref:tetratricopeptide repeat protein n=1 Tax=Thalassoglobus sp. JC818 TaxID=3232136 RepID=UPI00345B1D56
MDISQNLSQLMLEIGMMAAWRGETQEARVILDGLKAVRPESASLEVGTAIALLNEGKSGIAMHVLEEALKKDPESSFARYLLALTHKLNGLEDRSRTLCVEVMENSSDDIAADLARSLMQIPAGGLSFHHTPA